MRTFISVELTTEIKQKISELINKLGGGETAIKWGKAENLHITLKFLGNVEDNKIENLIELASKAVAGTGSFKAKFKGVGTFPGGSNPRIIWVGTDEGGDKLCNLAKNLEETLSNAGYKSEEREFRPHITIGRIKGKTGLDKLKEKLLAHKESEFGEALIDRIHVMKSTLTPKGPLYEKIQPLDLARGKEAKK